MKQKDRTEDNEKGESVLPAHLHLHCQRMTASQLTVDDRDGGRRERLGVGWGGRGVSTETKILMSGRKCGTAPSFRSVCH